MDAGFKAPTNYFDARGVEKDPSLILTRQLESEALGMLALHYQRADERPGTFWWTLTDKKMRPSRSERVR